MGNSGSIRLSVRVKPASKKEEVILEGDAVYIRVSSPPVDGRANERVVELLSDFFSVPKSKIKVLRGRTSRHKLVEIEGINKTNSKFQISNAKCGI